MKQYFRSLKSKIAYFPQSNFGYTRGKVSIIIAYPPPRRFGTAKIPPKWLMNMSLETLKLGVTEMLNPP